MLTIVMRKAITFLLGTFLIIFIVLYWLIQGVNENEDLNLDVTTEYLIGGVFALGLWVLPFFLIYGLPVTIFSDWITRKFRQYKRINCSFIIHLFFGLSFLFIVEFFTEPKRLFTDFSSIWEADGKLMFFGATIASFLFWFFDEMIRLIFSLFKRVR